MEPPMNAHVNAAKRAKRKHLEVAQRHRDVYAGGRLDLIDLALPPYCD
jgi:hypothetical protein